MIEGMKKVVSRYNYHSIIEPLGYDTRSSNEKRRGIVRKALVSYNVSEIVQDLIGVFERALYDYQKIIACADIVWIFRKSDKREVIAEFCLSIANKEWDKVYTYVDALLYVKPTKMKLVTSSSDHSAVAHQQSSTVRTSTFVVKSMEPIIESDETDSCDDKNETQCKEEERQLSRLYRFAGILRAASNKLIDSKGVIGTIMHMSGPLSKIATSDLDRIRSHIEALCNIEDEDTYDMHKILSNVTLDQFVERVDCAITNYDAIKMRMDALYKIIDVYDTLLNTLVDDVAVAKRLVSAEMAMQHMQKREMQDLGS